MVFQAVAFRFQQALYAVASLFIVYPTPATMDYISPLADLQMQVGQWATLALLPGQSRDVARETVVISATHYKSQMGKEDEKLLVVLKTPRVGASAGKMTYVVTDRGPHRDESTLQRENSSPSSSPVVSAHNVSPPSQNVRANDRIFIPGTHAPTLDRYKKDMHPEYAPLWTVTLSTPMALAQLAILLKTVNDHSIHYDLRKHQCYWYAYTVWEILHTQFGGDVAETEVESRRERYIDINVRREDSVAAITEEYRSAWQVFCEEDMGTNRIDEEAIRQVNFVAYQCMRYLSTIFN
jgi:hypothetical protein